MASVVYVFAQHEIECIKLSVKVMDVPQWTKNEAKDILKQCKGLRKSIDSLEKKAKKVLATKTKVLPFEMAKKNH